MKLFVAIQQPDIIRDFYNKTQIKLNVLISFWYLSGNYTSLTEEYRHMIDLLYLDSGAYSAYRSGAQIILDDYLSYLQITGPDWDQYFNLDNNFDNPTDNFINQQELEKNLPTGYKRPIPVVHDEDDPFGELERYVNRGHDYVAIGSIMRGKGEFLARVNEEYPELKIHLFGDLTRKVLRQCRLYSADSASFAHEARLGRILYWDIVDNKEYKIDLEGRAGQRVSNNSIPFSNFHHKAELKMFLDEKFQYTRRRLLYSEEARKVVNLYFFHNLQDMINDNSEESSGE